MGPIPDENHRCQPTVGKVGRPKSELGEVGTVALVLMGRMSVTQSDDEILEETAKIHDSPQRILVEPPSIWALRSQLRTICSSAWADDPFCALVVPFQRDRYQESGQSTAGTQKKRGRDRFGPGCGRKSWVLAHR